MENIKIFIQDSIETNIRLLNNSDQLSVINQITLTIINAYQHNGKILLAGNGGSAGDAQHIAGELVSRFYFDRPALAAIALTTDSSILTGIVNDYSGVDIFARQVEALGRTGDVFIAISTSGRSPNILKALEQANQQGLTTVGFTGNKENNSMPQYCRHCLIIPSMDTPRIQEAYILAGHIVCALVEAVIYKDKKPC